MRVCPAGVLGSSYSVQLQGDGGCGPALPYQYKVLNGALPAGLSLSKGGLISGTPTGAGTAVFWIELSDENPPSQSWCAPPKTAEREFSITIAPGFRITNQTAKPGTVNAAYSEQLSAAIIMSQNPPAETPATAATWSLNSGALPPGVLLGANGLLSGTPTTEGSYQFVVRAQLDSTRIDTETLTIVVRQPVAIKAPLKVSSSEVGVPFELKLAAAGGTETFSWAITSGALPSGVELGTDGTISGTPTAGGRFAFTATASDTELPTPRTSSYAGVVTVAQKLAISTLRLKPGKVGRLYRAKLATTGGVQPKTWKLKGKLPRGVRFDKTLGVLSGTPLKPGRYRITAEATDALKVKSTKTFTIVVLA